MKDLAQWLLAAVLVLVCAWALWAIQRPDIVHQLTLLLPLC